MNSLTFFGNESGRYKFATALVHSLCSGRADISTYFRELSTALNCTVAIPNRASTPYLSEGHSIAKLQQMCPDN